MQCARHPDVAARGTCARCGDFVCEACRHPRYPDHCGSCGDRLPQGIAWEDPRYGPWPWRFLLTLRDVLVRPEIAFPGRARVGPALQFVALGGACSALLFLAAVGVVLAMDAVPLPPELDGPFSVVCIGTVSFLALGTGAPVLLTLVLASSFSLGLLTVGRHRGLMRIGVRASGYALGVFGAILSAGVLLAAVVLLAELPRQAGHVSWIVVAVVWPPLTGRVFVTAARGLGLGSGRSILAALGPTVLCTIPAALLTHMQLGLLAG